MDGTEAEAREVARGRQTRSSRLARQIEAQLAGRSSGQVTLKVTLTGPAAEHWRAIVVAAEGLHLDNRALVAALLEAGGTALRRALQVIPR
ncbi:MAG: hypothetical protein H6Q00_1435 [Holophagaceae bacterium]|nr:hypothetical protein [Holophagaceae bacterium]